MTETQNHPLKNRTVLVLSSQTEFAELVENAGAHVLRCPQLEIQPPEDFNSMDEAIENLFGYDWLIFVNNDSVRFFLTRLRQLGHETSELDSIRVCAIGEPTAATLEESQVHVDLVCGEFSAVTIIDRLANYLGGHDKLAGLNFVIPQAADGRDYLKPNIEDAGARADIVAAYRTTAASDSSLLRLRTIVESGGVDCFAFIDPSEGHGLARLLDTNDLSRLFKNVALATLDDQTAATALTFGLTSVIKPKSPVIQSLIDEISSYFST
jgi:uroporphyrinogen III methyltransferase / synthase